MTSRSIIEQYKKRNAVLNNIQDTKQIQLIGDSMLPVLNPDVISVLFITKDNDYNVGDIVAFKNAKSVVGVSVHRIICKQGNVFRTKGDNSLQCDEKIDVSDIIGKVEKILLKNSYIASINASKYVAWFSKLEVNLSKRLPKNAMHVIHRMLLGIYGICASAYAR